MKVRRIKGGLLEYYFFCPACECGHGFRTKDFPAPEDMTDEEKEWFKSKWEFNGDMDKPTIKPSLSIAEHEGGYKCHFFVTNGMIEFLDDCTHDLAGQTVEIPSFSNIGLQDKPADGEKELPKKPRVKKSSKPKKEIDNGEKQEESIEPKEIPYSDLQMVADAIDLFTRQAPTLPTAIRITEYAKSIDPSIEVSIVTAVGNPRQIYVVLNNGKDEMRTPISGFFTVEI